MKAIALVATSTMIAAQAWSSPADIMIGSAPKVGAEPPKAQDIADGDVSVATTTGAVQYSYPIAVPPGRLGLQPHLALNYSSQAPIYGGIASGWTLSGVPDIRWDGSRGLKDRASRTEDPRDYLHYVSSLAGGRPLVQVTEPNGLIGPNADKTFRAQNDSSYSRYERMADGQPVIWRVLVPDGTTHYFGEASRITNWTAAAALARAPLTTTVDPWGNQIEYYWIFDTALNEYRLDRIAYGSNPGAGLTRFAEVRFTYVPPTYCNGSAIGAQEDFKVFTQDETAPGIVIHPFTDGAWRLTHIIAVALDPNAADEQVHLRDVTLEYDGNTEACGAGAQHAPFRQLTGISERVSGKNAVGTTALVAPAPMHFTYGDASYGVSTPESDTWPSDPASPPGLDMSYNLSWGYRDRDWPSVQAMMLDLDGDGRPDRLFATTMVTPEGTRCAIDWRRNVLHADGTIEFEAMPYIPLPTLPWHDAGLDGDATHLSAPNGLLDEFCTLNYQQTQRNFPDSTPPANAGPVGAFLAYRFLDMDSDGHMDLVTAIHHNHLTYELDDANGEQPFGVPWPACDHGVQPACAEITAGCLDGVYGCDETKGCGILDEQQLADCATSVNSITCDAVIDLDTCTPAGCSNATCFEQHTNFDPSCYGLSVNGGPKIRGHQRCGQFVWEIWWNHGVVDGELSIDTATPSFRLQPLPLESYSGDASMGANSYVASSHGVMDLDGDGFTDIFVREGYPDVPPPNAESPFLWYVFPGDGNGGFIRDLFTGRHIFREFGVPPGVYANSDEGHYVPSRYGYSDTKDHDAWGRGQLTDLNGDGLPDYVVKDVPGGSSGLFAYKNRFLQFDMQQQGYALGGGSEISRTYFTTDDGAFVNDPGDPDEGKILAGDRETVTRRFDLDFDHRDDVYTQPSSGTAGTLYFNGGGTFPAAGTSLNPGTNATMSGIRQPVDAPDTTVNLLWQTKAELTDLDGDGLYENVSWDPQVMHRYRRDPALPPPRLLATVTNGRGLTTKVAYSSMSDPSVVNNDPFDSETATSSPRTQWVVRAITVCDDFAPGNSAECAETDAGDATTRYHYKYPWFGSDDEGRFAFRGFQEVTTTAPKGSTTTQRYKFGLADGVDTFDWSGRLVTTVVSEAAPYPFVHSIQDTTWETDTLILGSGSVTTYHPQVVESWTCGTGVLTEATCKATPAGYTRSASTWTALPAVAPLLHAETEKTQQDSVAFDDGDRKTTTTFTVFVDATNYRLRDLVTESKVRSSGTDVLFRHSAKTWDAAFKQPELETVWFNSTGTDAGTTQREYDAVGNVVTIRKPEQYQANGPRLTMTYDARKLFVIATVNELGLDTQTDWDYGTGVKVWEKGSNVRTCDPSCPTDPPGAPLPRRDEKRTTIDGLGRPLQVEVSIPYYPGTPSGQTYAYSKVETFAYVDTATASVPTSVVHKQRILHDEDRWTENDTLLDGHGRPTKVTEKVNGTAPVDAITTYQYDIDGKLIAVSVPDPTTNNGDVVQFTYTFDSLGRPTGMRRPDATNPTDRSGITISYAGLTESRQEVAGIAGGSAAHTELVSDAFGRLTTVREFVDNLPPNAAVTTYSFSPADEVKQIVGPAPENITTILDHDLGGRRTAITRGTRTWHYTYDRNGNMATEQSPTPTSPPNQEALYTTSFVYDALDRMTSKLIAPRDLSQADRDLFGASSMSFTWDQALYNRQGRLVYFSTRDHLGNNVFNGRYFYDVEGNIIDEDRGWHVGSLTIPARGESYRWGAFNRLKSVINADGWGTSEGPSTTKTIYDDRGNPQKLQLVRPGLNNQYVGVQTRNVAGLVTKRRTDASGAQTTYIESNWSYDKLGRVTSQVVQKGTSPTQIARQDLTYSGTDDPTRLQHWIGDTNLKDFTFSFDWRHQLTQTLEASSAFTSHYYFKPSGRFDHTDVAPTALPGSEVRPRDVDYVYSSSDPEEISQLTIRSGPNTGTPYAVYGYDLAGNQTSRTYYTDTTLPQPQLLGTPQTWTFLYDGDDQLRRATSPDGTVEEYWYDQNGQRALLRTTPSGGSATVRWFDKNTEVELDGAGALVKTWAYASMGTPVARIENRNDRTELQFHGVSSNTLAAVVTGIGDNSPGTPGLTTAVFTYSAFGEVLEASGSEPATHRRRINDKYSDSNTGLVYYGARFMDPVTMMWTQSDPMYRFMPDAAWNSPRRAELYGFDINNPLRYSDPDGRDPETVKAAVDSMARAGRAASDEMYALAVTLHGDAPDAHSVLSQLHTGFPPGTDAGDVAKAGLIGVGTLTGAIVLEELVLAVAAVGGGAEALDQCGSDNTGTNGPGAVRMPVYEANPKHGATPRYTAAGTVSPAPKDGPGALAKSVSINEKRRVAYDKKNNEFVVFQRHEAAETKSLPDKFHGYAVPWNELRNEEKAALINHDIVDHRGNPE